MPKAPATLVRDMGLVGLAATGICSMMGAAINVVPLMLHRNVPGIGPWVLAAYVLAITPALLAALAYAHMASAMPRAGGSYLFASRSLSPYLGFVASFSQWFGLCIAIGVVSYLIVPFLRDIADALGWDTIAGLLAAGPARLLLPLLFLWTFTAVNVRGIKLYERILVPMMIAMFAGGAVVVVAGFAFDHADFAAAALARGEGPIPAAPAAPFDLGKFLAASVILFSSFIGFDSIAQAGGEAKNPHRALPLAIGIAVLSVGSFYMLFTAAMYHTIPWQYVAERALTEDLTAPGLLGYLLPTWGTVAIIAGAAIALINDLPAMLLAVSRLMFAWAEDGIFPESVTRIHPRFRTPWVAILASACMASAGIVGSHLAGDFFLGVDILVTGMLINFLLVCLSMVFLPTRNPALGKEGRVVRSRPLQVVAGVTGALWLGGYLVVHIGKDLAAEVPAWYFHSTWLWVAVMAVASGIFVVKLRELRSRVDLDRHFSELPPQ